MGYLNEAYDLADGPRDFDHIFFGATVLTWPLMAPIWWLGWIARALYERE